MPAAGDTIVVATVPGSRIATTEITSDSAAITTTETVVLTVVAPLVIGRIYQVRAAFNFALSVATDTFDARIREDSLTGGQRRRIVLHAGSVASFHYVEMETEYTADATESKTIVVTLDRLAGTGNITMQAASSTPAYLYVNYIRDS